LTVGLGEHKSSSNWFELNWRGEFEGKRDLEGEGTREWREEVLGRGVRGLVGLSSRSQMDWEDILGGLKNSAFLAGVTPCLVFLLERAGLGLFRASFARLEQGLRPAEGRFSFRPLSGFSGVLACLLGDNAMDASSSLAPDPDLFRGLLFGVAGAAAAFLLDLGVLIRASGSDTGCNIFPLALELLLVCSSPPDMSSTSTGFTDLPALALVFLTGRSSLAWTWGILMTFYFLQCICTAISSLVEVKSSKY